MPGTPLSSVIVMTSNDDADLIDSVFQIGVHAFVVKPVNMGILRGMVKRTLELNRYQDDLRRQIDARERDLKLLQTTFDNIAEGVITLDAELRVRMISTRACRILDLTEELVLNQPIYKIFGAGVVAPGTPLDGLPAGRRRIGQRTAAPDLYLRYGKVRQHVDHTLAAQAEPARLGFAVS